MNAMKRNQFYILLLFFSVFLSSCSIEKRHYTGGYHVETFKNVRPKVVLIERRSAEKSLDSAIKNQNTLVISQSLISGDTVLSLESPVPQSPNPTVFESTNDSTPMEHLVSGNSMVETRLTYVSDIPEPSPGKRSIEPIGFFSLITGIVGFFVPVLGAFFFFVAAIAGGIMSVKKIRRSQEKYKGAIFGIAAAIIGLIGLITILWLLFAVGAFAF